MLAASAANKSMQGPSCLLQGSCAEDMLHAGLPCEPRHSLCAGRNEMCIGRGPAYDADDHGFQSNEIIAGRQAAKAAELWAGASGAISGELHPCLSVFQGLLTAVKLYGRSELSLRSLITQVAAAHVRLQGHQERCRQACWLQRLLPQKLKAASLCQAYAGCDQQL